MRLTHNSLTMTINNCFLTTIAQNKYFETKTELNEILEIMEILKSIRQTLGKEEKLVCSDCDPHLKKEKQK